MPHRGINSGADRGALGVNQAGTIVTVFSGSSVFSPTRATSVVIPLRNRVDASRSPVRHPSAPRSPPGPRSSLAWDSWRNTNQRSGRTRPLPPAVIPFRNHCCWRKGSRPRRRPGSVSCPRAVIPFRNHCCWRKGPRPRRRPGSYGVVPVRLSRSAIIVVGEKGLGPGGDRGAMGLFRAAVWLGDRVDALRSPVRSPTAVRSPPGSRPSWAWTRSR